MVFRIASFALFFSLYPFQLFALRTSASRTPYLDFAFPTLLLRLFCFLGVFWSSVAGFVWTQPLKQTSFSRHHMCHLTRACQLLAKTNRILAV